MKDNNRDSLKNLAIFAGFLLVSLFSVYIYSPVIKSNASDSSTAKITTLVNSIASLSLDTEEVTFDFIPTVDGKFESKAITATSNTNSSKGYDLYFSSEDDSVDMVHTNSDITDTIASDFSATVTSETMPTNSWGYSIDNTVFSPIPTLTHQQTVKSINHYPIDDERSATVYIGAKISTALTSGSYSKTVVFSVIAHSESGSGGSGSGSGSSGESGSGGGSSSDPALVEKVNKLAMLTSMQDPNLAQFCSESYTPTINSVTVTFDKYFYDDLVPRANLEDTRDGKKYLVSKLADGNCWMSQDLELDLSANTPVVISNNDGTTSTATPNLSTQTSLGTAWDEAENSWRSYKTQSDELYYRDGYIKSSTPTYDSIFYNWEKTGNYYNWYAATAGAGNVALVDGDVTTSICPKGWRLPAASGPKSFDNLLSTVYQINPSGQESATAITTYPFNFLIAGYYHFYYGNIADQGANGHYWTTRAGTETIRTYALGFDNANVYTQWNSKKGQGFTMRCVAI